MLIPSDTTFKFGKDICQRTTENIIMVGAAGFEPATSCSQSRRATAAPRPDLMKWMVPPGRFELPHLTPEASALSPELRGP